jgi:CBS domain containing-hemolysin-like protein
MVGYSTTPHVAILVMRNGRNLNRKKRRKRMNEENRMITIDGKEYNFEELEDNQKAMVNHVASLNSKTAQARFDLDQLVVAQDAFTKMLVASVNEVENVDKA